MQFIDLAAQQKSIRDEIVKNINRVMEHGKYINGPEVKQLEEILAEFVGVKHAVGCASGTDALLMPLMAYGITRGDAVFTSPFTFIATAEVISLLGATPVFVDIHADTFNIDAEKLTQSIEYVIKEGKLKPKGIIPVDLFGQPADYDEINALAQKYNLFVLEDAAQGFGAVYKDKRACSLADVAATSFFPAKPLGCYGDGGMIFTNNGEFNKQLLSIRVHGQGNDKYDNIRIGINGRLDTMQAAILLAKFSVFKEEIEKRQEISARYDKALKDTCQVPFIEEYNQSAWAQYSILHEKRNEMVSFLKSQNIPTAIYYPKPLHLQQAFSYLNYKEGNFPVSERIAKQIISLPMHPYLAKDEQDIIIQALHTVLK